MSLKGRSKRCNFRRQFLKNRRLSCSRSRAEFYAAQNSRILFEEKANEDKANEEKNKKKEPRIIILYER